MAHIQEDAFLSFVSNNSKKPQTSGAIATPGQEHWALLSTAELAEPEYSTNSRGYKKVAEDCMLASVVSLVGKSPDEFRSQHKSKINRINHWEDALAMNTPPLDYIWDDENSVGWCGDFCVAPSVDEAEGSGVAIAN